MRLPHLSSDVLAAKPREPYTIERYPAIGETIRLVGYGKDGRPCIDLTMPARRFTWQTMKRLQVWLQAEDEHPTPPSISLVE